MTAGIFIVQQNGESQYFPIANDTSMIVTLSDYNDKKHLRFVMLNITSELPSLISCEGRWYSNQASWSDTLPEGERIRSYYRQKEGFTPPEGKRTFVAKPLTQTKPRGLQAILSSISALWEEILLIDFYRR